MQNYGAYNQEGTLHEQFVNAQQACSSAEARLHMQTLAQISQQDDLRLLQAECRDLRRQLAETAPQSHRSGSAFGGFSPRQHPEQTRLMQEVLDLRSQLNSRPTSQEYEALQRETFALRQELAIRKSPEEMHREIAHLKAELCARPTVEAHRNLQYELQQLHAELQCRPTAQEHAKVVSEVVAMREQFALFSRQSSDDVAEVGRVREQEAVLRNELIEAHRELDLLRKRNTQMSSDLAASKAQGAADGAKWIGELAQVRHAECQHKADLRQAQEALGHIKGDHDHPEETRMPGSMSSFAKGYGSPKSPRPPPQQQPEHYQEQPWQPERRRQEETTREPGSPLLSTRSTRQLHAGPSSVGQLSPRWAPPASARPFSSSPPSGGSSLLAPRLSSSMSNLPASRGSSAGGGVAGSGHLSPPSPSLLHAPRLGSKSLRPVGFQDRPAHVPSSGLLRPSPFGMDDQNRTCPSEGQQACVVRTPSSQRRCADPDGQDHHPRLGVCEGYPIQRSSADLWEIL
mmetsp:Transcript_164207/g.522184  ORF Transcript_164207/g.522184 Transcript_164207/m.522184 type:complete len:515 (-) Transcript_164207:222-1766(-)